MSYCIKDVRCATRWSPHDSWTTDPQPPLRWHYRYNPKINSVSLTDEGIWPASALVRRSAVIPRLQINRGSLKSLQAVLLRPCAAPAEFEKRPINKTYLYCSYCNSRRGTTDHDHKLSISSAAQNGINKVCNPAIFGRCFSMLAQCSRQDGSKEKCCSFWAKLKTKIWI